MSNRDAEPLSDVDRESVSPESVDPAEVEAALAHEEALVRQRGARICAELAREDADAIRRFADRLGDLLADDSVAVARLAGTALLVLAEDHPSDLVDSLPQVVGLFDTDLGGIRLLGAQLFSPVVLERPEACVPYLEDVIDALEAIDETERGEVPDAVVEDHYDRRQFERQEEHEGRLDGAATEILSNVLVALAESAPEAVADSVDDLLVLLEAENATIVGGAVDALAEVAAVDPGAVEPAIDPLIDCLDHPADAVRARAILALAETGDERAISELRRVAEEDDEEEVREMAAEVADAIEGTR